MYINRVAEKNNSLIEGSLVLACPWALFNFSYILVPVRLKITVKPNAKARY